MANMFHSAELAVERERDKRFNKFMSYIYEYASDFGSSALRPVLWLSALMILTIATLYITDGAAPAIATDEEYSDWRADLTSTDTAGRRVRAIYLTVQSTFNPLGLVSPRSLVVPSSTGIAVLLGVHSLLALIFVALFVLAVRRRFKMS